MDLTKETIDRILELSPARTINVDGFTYLDKDKSVTMHKPPTPNDIDVSTLTGLVDVLEAGFEGMDYSKILLHVNTHNQVLCGNRVSDIFGRRQTFITADRIKPDTEFQFGQYIAQESFVIKLRSLFVQTPELDSLVRLAGNLAAKNEVHQQDDGFGQSVTTKAGIHRLDEVVVNPRVSLRPFRTFLEAEQPESVFLFRVKYEEGKGNQCALFEADGGNWKLSAMQNVKTWLSNQLKGSSVQGLGDIPIIC